MGYERYPRGTNQQGDYTNRGEAQDYGRDYGSNRYDSYSSGRDYRADDIGRDGQRRGYGSRDYGYDRYAQRDQSYGQRGYGADRSSGGRDGYGEGASERQYHGSYASDGRRFEDVGRYRDADDDNRASGDRGGRGGYGGQPQGYDYQDRGFLQRAGDEVRSWFGDDDAERRREADARRDEQRYGRDFDGNGRHRDSDYHGWRSTQIAALDRDYEEYRRENRSKFENEFSSWRTNRQSQRDLLNQVTEHMEVVGSDGEHVGTIDKVRGDRILLTKNDVDAGGQHHSFPSSWIQSVADKVTLNKSAADAKRQWQDEERNQAMFQYGDNSRASRTDATPPQASNTARTY